MKIIYFNYIYNLLIKTVFIKNKNRLINKYWQNIWRYSLKRYNGIVETTIHGYKVKLNNCYSYPIYSRLFKELNNPLLELAYQTWKEKGDKISIIDVGAAIGDTILLIDSNIPDCIGRSFCIDGDKEFFEYQKMNLKQYSQIECINSLLTDIDNTNINDLVRIHSGTASSIGVNQVNARTLDSIMIEKKLTGLDLLKIDVDGFDGKVLLGSENLLKKFKPNIIFEWHPLMINKTGNDFMQVFNVLDKNGYDKYLWYTKYGAFSHFDLNSNSFTNRIEWKNICLRNIYDDDFHFDIISLHKDSKIDITSLSELQFAKNKKSKY